MSGWDLKPGWKWAWMHSSSLFLKAACPCWKLGELAMSSRSNMCRWACSLTPERYSRCICHALWVLKLTLHTLLGPLTPLSATPIDSLDYFFQEADTDFSMGGSSLSASLPASSECLPQDCWWEVQICFLIWDGGVWNACHCLYLALCSPNSIREEESSSQTSPIQLEKNIIMIIIFIIDISIYWLSELMRVSIHI